jgi:hypothetical protein
MAANALNFAGVKCRLSVPGRKNHPGETALQLLLALLSSRLREDEDLAAPDRWYPQSAAWICVQASHFL